ncbi:MAG: hypothetical protein ACRD6B_10510 [Bryobacteraceae bacterium]
MLRSAAWCNRSMQVPVLGSGEMLRLLEAMLPLPKLERMPAEHKAAPTPAREDEAILRYAVISETVQSVTVQSVENPPVATLAPVLELVSQPADSVAQTAAAAPHLEQAVLQMPVAHALSHIGYASYHPGTVPTQGAIDVPAYIPPILQTENSSCKIEPARRVRVAGWGQVARGIRKLWLRAPLLVLLLSWLVAGLIAAAVVPLNAVFELWGLGFLALVGLGFYTRVRNIRF